MNASDDTMQSIAFDFLFDPLCGWCYGAAPTIAALRTALPVRFDLYPIGLFYKEGVRPMDTGIAQYIRQVDQRLSQMTGQPLGKDYMAKLVVAGAPALNSAPAIRAILAAESGVAGKGLDLQETLQKARFVDGRDITDSAEIAKIAAENGIELEKTITEADVDRRIAASRQLLARYGMNGVPALVLRGIGDWEGQLDEAIPNRLNYDLAGLVAYVRDRLSRLA
jgi:putative protein-disulfide isomerase